MDAAEERQRYLDTTPAPVDFTMGELRALSAWAILANQIGATDLFALTAPDHVRLGMMGASRKIAQAINEHGDMTGETPEDAKEYADAKARLVADEDQLRAQIMEAS